MKKILYIGNRLKHDKVTLSSVDTLGDLFRKEGYRVKTASGKKNKVLRLLDMCFSVIRFRKEVDVVLIDTYSTWNFYYAVVVAWWCRRFKIPYIPVLHGGDLPNRIHKSRRLSKTVFHKAKVNISTSNYLMHAFQDAGYTNLMVIPNSLEIKDYNFQQRKMVPKLLWVRSFSEIYNPMLALKVIKKVQKSYPDASLCMVGPEKDGSLEQCRKWAQEHNIPVLFTGKLSKDQWTSLAAEYAIFINTTNFDNTPVSVMEAMALGLPVVSTNVGGIPYLLKNREDAILVEPNDPEAMAKAVLELLNDSMLAKKISDNARQKTESFDWEEVKQLWKPVLE